MSAARIRVLSLIFAGVLYALGFPTTFSTSFIITPILGVAIFLFLLKTPGEKNIELSWKSQSLNVLLFSLGYYLMGYYWIPFTVQEFGQIPAPANFFIGLILAPFLMPHLWAFIFIRKLFIKVQKIKLNKTFKLFAHSLLFTVLEYFIPQQFPAHLGHPWIELAPYLGLATIFGAPIFTFISFSIARSLGEYVRFNKVNLYHLGVVGVFIVANLLTPLSVEESDRKTNIRVVQANIGSIIKVLSEQNEQDAYSFVTSSYSLLSGQPTEKPIDMIIWPETALPGVMDSKDDYIQFPYFVTDLARQMQAEMIFGGYDTAKTDGPEYFEDQYNSVFHVNKNGQFVQAYHKHMLLPFGETMPFGPLNYTLSKYIPGTSFFAKGKSFPIFTTEKGVRYMPTVCYELLFPRFINNFLNKHKDPPHFIVNVTNDSWFGDTAEPYQHLYLTKWRAMETAIPIIRSTNTGITSVIFPNGKESERKKIGEVGVLDIELSVVDREPTLYQRFGFQLCMFIMLLLTIIGIRFDPYYESENS